ncbi:MAG: hypothetical protein JSW06_09355 [Thermoplasmatales archaeon]|nr:MAG: hypothetical protein JSW06_09355 [Thermoplasmatales archaeon]
MKKILPLLVVSILVLSGLGAVAVPEEKQIENKPLSTQDWGMEIEVLGDWFGYVAFIGPTINESVTGDYIINISTNASIMIIGRELGYALMNLTLDEPEYPIRPDLRPLIGFGFATINILINVSITDPVVGEFLLEKQVKGFVLPFYVLCPKTTFTIP